MVKLVFLLVLVAACLITVPQPVQGVPSSQTYVCSPYLPACNGGPFQPVIYTRIGDAPTQVIWNASCNDQVCGSGLVAHTFWFYWPYHLPSLPSPPGSYDWEPIYVYADAITQQASIVAWRIHFQWYFSNGTASVLTAPNSTQPVITFQSGYHFPNNAYPNATLVRSSNYQTSSYSFTAATINSTIPTTVQIIDPFTLLTRYNIPFKESMTVNFALLHLAVFIGGSIFVIQVVIRKKWLD